MELSTPPYYQLVGLRRDPFAAAYDESTYFLTPELQQRLDLSLHLLEFSQQVLLINGEHGVGKSHFCEHLASSADENWLVCKTQADGQTGPGELVKSLLRHCPDILQEETETVASLDRFLEYCHLNSKQAVLIIDDSHLLDRTTIKFVLQMIEFRFEESFLRVVLVANASFSGVLQEHAEALSNTNLIHAIVIPAFTAEQTGLYVRHRLQACGGSGEEFSDKELGRIHKVAAGIAADINFLAKQGLADPAQFSQAGSASSLLSTVIGHHRQILILLLSAALLSLFSTFLFLDENHEESTESKTLTLDLPPPKTANLNTRPRQVDSNDSVQPVSKGQVGVTAARPIDTKEKSAGKPSSAENSLVSTVEMSIAEPLRAELAPANSLVPGYTDLKSSGWLQQQDSSSFTLQLMRAREVDTIARFIADSGLDQAQLAIYNETSQGQQSYVLLFGVFPDLPQARAAVAALPQAARSASPWPKAIKAVQEVLQVQE